MPSAVHAGLVTLLSLFSPLDARAIELAWNRNKLVTNIHADVVCMRQANPSKDDVELPKDMFTTVDFSAGNIRAAVTVRCSSGRN